MEFFRNNKFYKFLVLSKVEQFDFLNVYVKVTKPLINVSHVPLLHIFEFIRAKIDVSVYQWHLEFAGVKLKFAIYNWKSTPADDLVLTGVFSRQIDQLKKDYV